MSIAFGSYIFAPINTWLMLKSSVEHSALLYPLSSVRGFKRSSERQQEHSMDKAINDTDCTCSGGGSALYMAWWKVEPDNFNVAESSGRIYRS